MEHTNGIENELIEGRNAITEALRAGRPIDKIYIAGGDGDRTLGFISTVAKDRGITVVECDRRKLDAMSETHAHQGVIAVCAVRDYVTVQDILDRADQLGEDPFVVVCDEITDSHNLGAIIRSAECAGAHGVIIPKRRSAGLTAVVNKASAGAAETANGAVERMVLLGLTGVYYIISAAMRLRCGRNQSAAQTAAGRPLCLPTPKEKHTVEQLPVGLIPLRYALYSARQQGLRHLPL